MINEPNEIDKKYDSDCSMILFELFYPYFIIVITVVIIIKPHNPV